MIAKLAGLLDSIGEDWAIIDVNGVGYLVFCSGRSLANLPQPGAQARLFIETHVREDHIHLYGFTDADERTWFRALLAVQGVGAKVALAILSVLTPADLMRAVMAQDKAILTRAPGVGPKVAGRIVSELKDKVAKMSLAAIADNAVAGAQGPSAGGINGEAISALVNLGYRPAEALAAIERAASQHDGDMSVEVLIRDGLKELAP
jgi:Holliday junction DNA helicase RuvA